MRAELGQKPGDHSVVYPPPYGCRMRRCGFIELSEQLNARVHMHVCETSDGDADSVGSYGLRTLQRLGWACLNDRLIGAHAGAPDR